MNVKLLRKVKRHILAEPKRLWMRSYARFKSDGTEIRRTYPKCGTVACVAGWALILNDKDPRDLVNIRETAALLLGISISESHTLFDPESWPYQFRAGLRDDGKAETAKIAAARIEHFIKTEGAE